MADPNTYVREPRPGRSREHDDGTSTAASAFLYFGYLPRMDLARGFADSLSSRRGADSLPTHASTEADRVREGAQVLLDQFTKSESGDNVVPLSAGLDSRTILALLRKRVEPGRIVAATFGVRGTWDYDLAPALARAAGVRHERIDLSEARIDADALLRTAEQGASWTFLLDAHFNRLLAENFSETTTTWSGYLGDAVTGAHLPRTMSANWQAALDHFVTRERMVRECDLADPRAVARTLPTGPHPALGHVSANDQLDLLVRQSCYVRRVVLASGRRFRAPFEEPEVMRYFLSLPPADRHGQRLYRQIIGHIDPELAAMPTTASKGLRSDAPRWRRALQNRRLRLLLSLRRRYPLVAWPLHPGTNYLDLDAAFRRRRDFRELGGDCISELQARGIVDHIDLDRLWRDHQRGRASLGYTLVLLCALELSLRADPDSLETVAERVRARGARDDWGVERAAAVHGES